MLTAQLKELNGWVFRRKRRQWTEEDDNRIGNMFVNLGFSYASAKAESQKQRFRDGGRPSARRPIAIAAWERNFTILRLLGPL